MPGVSKNELITLYVARGALEFVGIANRARSNQPGHERRTVSKGSRTIASPFSG